MRTLYEFKPRFQAMLRPVAGWCARVGISANAVTSAAMLMSGLLGVLIAATESRWLLLAYPPFLLLRMALNAIDGLMARELTQPTPLGALLNELGDLVSDAALYLPLALIFPAPPWIIVAIVVVALISEAAGIAAGSLGAGRRDDGPLDQAARTAAASNSAGRRDDGSFGGAAGIAAASVGAGRRYDGPFGKSDRAFAFSVLGVVVAVGVPAGWWLPAVLGGLLVLAAATVVNRVRAAVAGVGQGAAVAGVGR